MIEVTLSSVISAIIGAAVGSGIIAVIFKHLLSAALDRNLANYQSILRQSEIRYSVFHQRRIEIISKIYGLLYDAQVTMSTLTSYAPQNLLEPVSNARENLSHAEHFYKRNRIYIPKDTQAIIDKTLDELKAALHKLYMVANLSEPDIFRPLEVTEQISDAQYSLIRLVEDLPDLMEQLEHQVDKVLGKN